MPPKEVCQSCRCLVVDYCYGAYFNHNPEEKECPDYEPTTREDTCMEKVLSLQPRYGTIEDAMDYEPVAITDQETLRAIQKELNAYYGLDGTTTAERYVGGMQLPADCVCAE